MPSHPNWYRNVRGGRQRLRDQSAREPTPLKTYLKLGLGLAIAPIPFAGPPIAVAGSTWFSSMNSGMPEHCLGILLGAALGILTIFAPMITGFKVRTGESPHFTVSPTALLPSLKALVVMWIVSAVVACLWILRRTITGE
ncbi:hypothetical protein JCM5350_001768 [Sporobolomyces pararoseus]